jgi:hypothetical protein
MSSGDTPPLGPTSLFVALGLAGLGAVATFVYPLVPWPEERAMRAKYEYFAAHKDELDAVYIGSSRMLRGIDPRIVDAAVESRGRPFRSFNFGLDGMMSLEGDFVMRELLELDPARLRYVLFEANTWYGGYDAKFGNPGTDPHSQRSVYWHTVPQTMKALETLWRSDEPAWERLRLAGTHVETMAWKLVSYGQGPRIFAKVAGTDADELGATISVDEIAQARGYQPMEGLTDQAHTEGHAVFVTPQAQTRYPQLIAEIPASNAAGSTLSTYNFSALRSQYEVTASHGVELVYVVMPTVRGTPDPLALHAGGHVPVLFHYNDPEKYASIFAVDRRHDIGHLSRLGAEELSALIASSLAAEMERTQ